MICNQCRAQCLCSQCKRNSASAQRTLAVDGKKAVKSDIKDILKTSSLSKDEIYKKYLQETLNERALMDATKNAAKFIPDEQIVSSLRRREDKKAAIISQQLPLRRRDRLEELLILEHKARLKEEARLRRERLKLGILDEQAGEMVNGEALGLSKDASTQALTATGQESSSGHTTPPPRCSAEHDLNTTLQEIKDILKDEADAPPAKQLSHDHLFKLHQLLQSRDKKNRAQRESCPHQPHLCNHCFDVDVQARHLCPSANIGSVAYTETGKVINPEEGIRLGTDAQRGPDGAFVANDVTRFMASNRRLRDFNPHPYGTGVVFVPLSATSNHEEVNAKTNGNRVGVDPTSNSNTLAEGSVDAGLQYPGSTYNVYDKPAKTGRATKNGAAATATVKHQIIDPESNANEHAIFADCKEAEANPSADESKPQCKSSSALWRTTNQIRDMDMERFLMFQKMLKDNSRKVYESTAPCNTVSTRF